MARKEEPGLADVKAFVASAVELGGPVYVGIDPGYHGAIAFLCGHHYLVMDIPAYEVDRKRTVKVKKEAGQEHVGPRTRTVKGKATRFDNVGICAIFKALRPLRDRASVCLEVAQIQAVSRGGKAKKFGNDLRTAALAYGGYMMWPLFLYSRGYSLNECTPNVWKKSFKLTGKDKESSRHLALKLFPKAAITRKGDHDRAEALLLAEYLRRQLGQDNHPGH